MTPTVTDMSTVNIPLPDALKTFVDEQVAARGCSEYVGELIRADQAREHRRELLLDGAASAATEAIDDAYFDALRTRVLDTRTE